MRRFHMMQLNLSLQSLFVHFFCDDSIPISHSVTTNRHDAANATWISMKTFKYPPILL